MILTEQKIVELVTEGLEKTDLQELINEMELLKESEKKENK